MKYTGIFLCVLCMFACSNRFHIEKNHSNKPVIVRVNKSIKMITVIKFPFDFILKNPNFLDMKFGSIDYQYFHKEGGISIELYLDDQRITNDQLKVVRARERINFHIYTRHLADSSSITQNQLKPYVQKMLELDQDTLHVGTVAEFKKRHPELFKMLTENDTISIRHLKGRNSGLGERIAIPANW